MTTPLSLRIITASTRPGRVGPKVAQWVRQFVAEDGRFQAESIDLAALNLPLLDESAHPRMQQYQNEHTKEWSRLIAAGDAFLFVTPEYDYFAPASLVNAIQYLYHEWGEKPAGVVSYGGVSGGLRSTQELRLLISNVNMMPINLSVPIPYVNKLINEEGVFQPSDSISASMRATLDQLHRWGMALRQMRTGSRA